MSVTVSGKAKQLSGIKKMQKETNTWIVFIYCDTHDLLLGEKSGLWFILLQFVFVLQVLPGFLSACMKTLVEAFSNGKSSFLLHCLRFPACQWTLFPGLFLSPQFSCFGCAFCCLIFDAGVFQTISVLTLSACSAFVQILFSEFLAHWAVTDLFCQVPVFLFFFLSTRTNCQSCCRKRERERKSTSLTAACSLNWSACRRKGKSHLWTELHMKQQLLLWIRGWFVPQTNTTKHMCRQLWSVSSWTQAIKSNFCGG